MRVFIYALFPILVAVIITQYKVPLFRLLKMKVLRDVVNYKLAVGVLTARENFKQRQVIRDTWWNNKVSFKLADDVILRFVVGEEGCPHPQEYRQDPYDCQQWNVTVPPTEYIAAVTEEDLSASTSVNFVVTASNSLYFRVRHPVVIHKLGIHADSVTPNTYVKLVDTTTEKTIISLDLNSSSEGTLLDGYVYLLVSHLYELPEGFEGVVVVGSDDNTDEINRVYRPTRNIRSKFNFAGAVIQPLSAATIPMSNHLSGTAYLNTVQFTTVSFIFTVQNTEYLNHLFNSRKEKYERRKAVLINEQRKLEEENELHNDILFVPAVDTYRNIPLKLLSFYNWIQEEHSVDFVLKTDDDTFVDVQAIYSHLQETPLIISKKTWWGRFRHNWPVEAHGKWREEKYASPVYPVFACGSGYIIGADIVNWISQNYQHLEVYQGEDISMGIWMAAISPRRADDHRWLCDAHDCQHDLLVQPDLKTKQIVDMWRNKQQCDNPCGC